MGSKCRAGIEFVHWESIGSFVKKEEASLIQDYESICIKKLNKNCDPGA